ncbi:MAG: N-acetylneuraminate synthase family protein [Sulfuricurvum sp.]|uniref:N-acetylneuraminate synthase family protein n=1 Tax=Sulfuricurvum sp. TaxID=2025608 RepID=UPI0025EC7CED|nr:N-acetylneuraminate synthase family protein [Sulfuricurvum sp.]MBV5320161.1 N-acetylneuraminate synthase family protein [Sulfuricurvum sp.]
MKIIAEFCQNHNGSFDILKKMVESAAVGGATHVKIQSIFADDVTYRERFENGISNEAGEIQCIKRPYILEYERLKKLELTYNEHEKFISECKQYDLIPLTTAFTHGNVKVFKELGFKSVKVASYDCASLELIKRLAHSFDELIVSTGATFDNEIETAAEYLKNSDINFSLLHCVTMYPTPLTEMHLNRMQYLKQYTESVGLSEHSLVSRDGIKASIAAIYCGADIIERHFTILPEEETRDGKVSIRKEHLIELNRFASLSRSDQETYMHEFVPEFSLMLGNSTRELSAEELLNRDYYRGRFASHNYKKPIYNWEVYPEELA